MNGVNFTISTLSLIIRIKWQQRLANRHLMNIKTLFMYHYNDNDDHDDDDVNIYRVLYYLFDCQNLPISGMVIL